jgi:hypothetical protein
MKKIFLLIFPITLALISCEKYIEFDEEIKKPKIVVNSQINPDSLFEVHLSKSLSVIDNAELSAIIDGTVNIYDENEQYIETLIHQQNGYYKGSTLPSANSTYHLKVSAPDFDPVTANTHIPEAITILQIDTSSYISAEGEPYIKLSITFPDNGSTKNYYHLEVVYAQELSGELYIYPIYFGSSDVSLDLGQDQVESASFTDDLFNGSEKRIEIYFIDHRAYYDFLQITLTSASRDIYLYNRTTQAFGQTQGNPFAEPVQVYNNIQGGFGIFGGFQKTRYKLFF